MNSYKVEVIADSTGLWVCNAVRLATNAEAEAYGADLARRWETVAVWRVAESEDLVNYEMTDRGLQSIAGVH